MVEERKTDTTEAKNDNTQIIKDTLGDKNTPEKNVQDGSVIITTRIRGDIYKIMKTINTQIGNSITQRQFIELGLLELFSKIDNDLVYEGINLRDYANLSKLEMQRNITKKERNEILSKNLFMARVQKDIFKLYTMNKTNPNIIAILTQYIQARKKEANFYADKEDLLKQLSFYQDFTLKNQLEKMKRYIEDRIEIKEIMESIEKENKGK